MNKTPPRGMALVIVLSMLVLLAVLILSFFTSVTAELSSSQSYANSCDTKQLADSAVNLVMGQIVQGTTGSNLAWSSQPGMIRTFDSSGNNSNFFKLYSSDAMVVDGRSFNKTSELPPTNGSTAWPAQRALYVDLNSPVANSSGVMNYPIIDGNGLVTLPNYPVNKPNAGSTYLTYDVNPQDQKPDIDGFYIEQAPTFNSANPVQSKNNPVPMPVRWLYVLQDGTILAPGGSGLVADFNALPNKPTARNPIVGRVAFWTDDETCKVNINTAAGDEKLQLPISLGSSARPTGITFGSFWDVPRAESPVEKAATPADWSAGTPIPGLAWNQPYQGEFQRYPGHPATVYLASVFPTFNRTDIGSIVPRVKTGGSFGGSTKLTTGAAILTPDADRLYSSLDELMYKPGTTSGSRTPNDLSKISREKLEQSKFFLTASSRAPEINLFGQPRVTIWPVHATNDNLHRTSQDRLLAFCSTIGSATGNNHPFYFTRRSADSSTADYAGRNPDLYSYLQQMTSKNIPGFGGNFVGKYTTSERDQILTEMYDYIRCTNLVDANLGQMSGGVVFTQKKDTPGSAVAAPIKITTSSFTTKGFGRFATLAEAAIQFYVAGITTDGSGNAVRKMKAVLLLRLFHPMHGYAPVYENIVEEATFSPSTTTPSGSMPWSVKVKTGSVYGPEASLGFPSTTVRNQIAVGGDGQPEPGWGTRPWGSNSGLAPQFVTTAGTLDQSKPLKTLGWTDSTGLTQYPFCTDPNSSGADIPYSSGWPTTFAFMGGKVTLVLKKTIAGDPVQTIELDFPASTQDWPLPKPALKPENYSYNGRISRLQSNRSSELIDQDDTVRALEALGPGGLNTPSAPWGDMRLVALNPNLTTASGKGSWFSPHRDYFLGSMLAHSLYPGDPEGGGWYPGASRGTLVQGTTGPAEIASGVNDIITSNNYAGDFDNGIARCPDGAYANKPDEGNILPGSLQPYFNAEWHNEGGQTYFSPNRQVASAVMFGSLPTGVMRNRPWQTLLFRPDPAGTHPGSASPKDHLLLDLFTMPVVEPYAISEPFSTAGKINLNYQIMPFGDSITRETGVRAALASTWMMAIPNGDGQKYKKLSMEALQNYRYPIDADTTLRQFTDRFNNTNNKNFITASEICDIDLYPADDVVAKTQPGTITGKTDVTYGQMDAFWANNKLTGDNTREMPYTHLYPLLTTKSNTFTVHLRVQTLKQIPLGRRNASDWATWTEGRDQVMGEYRGSTTIERYIDPNDARFRDGAINPDTNSVESAYKLRVVSVKQFAP